MFRHPWVLSLLVLVIPVIWFHYRRRRTLNPSLGLSSLAAFSSSRGWRVWALYILMPLQLAALVCLIVALARPQKQNTRTTSRVEGTDIVLAIDISESMTATDLLPSRFDAAREVAKNFVNARTDDNLGLVIFAGESLSIMPLTYDRPALIKAIENISLDQLGNGTAIGDGLASAINRVASGKAKSKSIILLTDGTNNAGEVAPSTAADIAASKGIKVYTIGVGTDGSMQITDPYGMSTTTMETKIDEEALKSIAGKTKGKYFRATDEKMLKQVFAEIDALEKTRMDTERYSRFDENFFPWILAAVIMMSLAALLRFTLLRRIP